MRKALCVLAAMVGALAVAPALAQSMTDQGAAQLGEQFIPQEVVRMFSIGGHQDQLQDLLGQLQDSWGCFHYLNFTMANDPNRYLLLGWGGGEGSDDLYWRLLKSQDSGATWANIQDAGRWYGPMGKTWAWWLKDLTGDGVPELIVESSLLGNEGGKAVIIFAWRNDGFTCITPENPGAVSPGDTELFSAFTSDRVELADVDSDGKAEVIVYPALQLVMDGPGDYHHEPVSPTRIYKYDGTSYVLWKTIPAGSGDPYPVTVPGIAVVHPGTIPISALQGGAKGNSDLQVFVSHPAGTNTVDDLDSGSLAFQGTLLTLKKRWPNQKQPDTTSANFEWEGCPVRQVAPTSNGDWNPPPEDPFLPSPDGKTEYHFVGPYLEFRLAASDVYPYLLAQAQDAFTQDPGRTAFFVSIPLSGKLKNGKLAAISALVCIKNTGTAPSKKADSGKVGDS